MKIGRSKRGRGIISFLKNCVFRGVEAEGPQKGTKTLFIGKDVSFEEFRACVYLAEQEGRNLYLGAGSMRSLPSFFFKGTKKEIQVYAPLLYDLLENFPHTVFYETTIEQALFENRTISRGLWEFLHIVLVQEVEPLNDNFANTEIDKLLNAIRSHKIFNKDFKTTYWYPVAKRKKPYIMTTGSSFTYDLDEEVDLDALLLSTRSL